MSYLFGCRKNNQEKSYISYWLENQMHPLMDWYLCNWSAINHREVVDDINKGTRKKPISDWKGPTGATGTV